MTKFAFTDLSFWVRQFDTAKPTELPYAVHRCATNVFGLSLGADKAFRLVYGPSCDQLALTTGPKSETAFFEHLTQIAKVRLRNVGGKERIYFSAVNVSGPPGPEFYEIYALDQTPLGWIAKPYTAIDISLLPFPNGCNPAVPDWHRYSGDFAFGDNDTLYLSSGRFGDCVVGIYRIDGAGPDTVTGTPKRIHLGDGPMHCLSFKSPNTLYFLRGKTIWKLDLVTMAESYEGMVAISGGDDNWVTDIVEVGDGLPPPPWWTFINAVYAGLIFTAKSLRGFGDWLNTGRGKVIQPPPLPPGSTGNRWPSPGKS